MLGVPCFASKLSHCVSDSERLPQRIETGTGSALAFAIAGPRSRLLFAIVGQQDQIV